MVATDQIVDLAPVVGPVREGCLNIADREPDRVGNQPWGALLPPCCCHDSATTHTWGPTASAARRSPVTAVTKTMPG